MRKNRNHILILCVGVALILLCGNTSASYTRISYNISNFSLFGDKQIMSGDSYIAKNGENVPTSIFYTDEAGGHSNFLAVSKISEMLDADVKWNSREKTVDFGTATTPRASTVNFPFTELGCQGRLEPANDAHPLLKSALFQSESEFNQTFFSPPRFGKYILISVTNQGEKPVSFTTYRDKTIGNLQPFPTDVIQPGSSVQRIFTIDEKGNELTSNLRVVVKPLAGKDSAPLNIVVDVMQQYELVPNLNQRSMIPSIAEEYDGLSMKIAKATSSDITLSILNHSNRDFLYGNDFGIEKNVYGQWEELQQRENAAVLPIEHKIEADNETVLEISLEQLYGELSEGTYRIKKGFSENASPQYCCLLIADFVV